MRHSGTHLILPLVKSLTNRPIFRPKGEQALICKPNGPVVVWLRNPRNRVVSAYRWKHGGAFPTDRQLANYIGKIKAGTHRTPISFMLAWAERWAGYDGLKVRFEDVTGPDGFAAVERLRAFLNGPADAVVVYAAIVGKGTFTGRHSDWREHFGRRTLAVWRDAGGERLDRLMGYDNA